MSKRILLTRGQFALVDDGDFDWLNQWKWYASYADKSKTGYYAIRGIIRNGKHTTIAMHRMILSPAPGMLSDHINGDGLDNRWHNLRTCTYAENCWNRRKGSETSSFYKGVSFHKGRHKWEAKIRVNYQLIYLGRFDTQSQAALVYNAAAREHFGEFANLNAV